VRWWALLLAPVFVVGCAKPEPSQPTPIQSVSVAPQTTGSPNEPTLLLGAPKPVDGADVERVKVKEDQPDAAWKPPKEQCPDGITEMISVHVPLGQTMALAPGAAPVSALGSNPDAADVTYDRGKKTVQVVARKYGLVFITVERERKCTLYGVSTGY
jgi:hypothetical protein